MWQVDVCVPAYFSSLLIHCYCSQKLPKHPQLTHWQLTLISCALSQPPGTHVHMTWLGAEGSWLLEHAQYKRETRRHHFIFRSQLNSWAAVKRESKLSQHAESAIMRHKPLLVYGLISVFHCNTEENLMFFRGWVIHIKCLLKKVSLLTMSYCWVF